MILLISFAFIAGVVTILSPCILPVLPIVLSGSVGGKQRPFGIVTGFVLSFTFFTLFLTTIVNATGVSPDAVRLVSVIIVFLFGLSLVLPQAQVLFEKLFAQLSQFMPKSQNQTGFLGGILIGFSLGLLWTPCVGPILASVISLALTGQVNGAAFFITLAYALGTAIPMLAITYGGRELLQRVPWLLKNTGNIQKGFGVLMMATAIAIFFRVDRTFQAYILEQFPQYETSLTSIDANEDVFRELDKLEGRNDGDDTQPEQQGGGGNTYTAPIPTTVQYPPAPEIIPGGEWFNSEPLTLEELRGNVVMIKFWTYTCINCIRTFPYTQQWHETYKDDGFVLIGVHTPEFEFEKNAANVQQALTDNGLTFPVIQDNEYATWRAYTNRYWPALYLIDKDGKVRYAHFGEGDYDVTEEKIKELLRETGTQIEAGQPPPLTGAPRHKRTHETYLGYGRMERFASKEKVARDREQNYSSDVNIPLDSFAYNGPWTVGKEHAQAGENAELTLHFKAKEVYLVMRPTGETTPTALIALNNEQIPPPSVGKDVQNSSLTIDGDKIYHIVSFLEPQEGTLNVLFPEGDVEVFAFTFG